MNRFIINCAKCRKMGMVCVSTIEQARLRQEATLNTKEDVELEVFLNDYWKIIRGEIASQDP